MKLSVITATFNAVEHLPNLLDSLRGQTDLDFEWVVMDGCSSDGTVALLAGIEDLQLVYRSEPDFGIYDALNKAIRLARGEYYLVVGADDVLEPTAIASYKALIEATRADIVTTAVRFGEQKIIERPRGAPWWSGHVAYVTGHAVGSAYRKSLHERATVGFYSRVYPIAADQLFIKRAVAAGASIAHGTFLAGTYSDQGVSSVNLAGTLTEFFRVQLETEKNRSLQVLLFLLRIVRHMPRLVRSR